MDRSGGGQWIPEHLKLPLRQDSEHLPLTECIWQMLTGILNNVLWLRLLVIVI